MSVVDAVASIAPADTAEDAVSALLQYADQLRTLSGAELNQELHTLGTQAPKPATAPRAGLSIPPERAMRLALALMQLRQPVETARALALLQSVKANNGAESKAYKPLARLMIDHLMSVRRLEDTAERQERQLRESQRRFDQLSERLKAMRAIERSLNLQTSPNPPNDLTPKTVVP